MRKALLSLFAILLLVGAIAFVFRKPIALRLMERVVAQNMAGGLLAELPDGLHVALCGAGSPLPDSQRSGPCVAVIAGRKLYVVDTGAGSSRILARMRLQQGKISAIFLTHFHSDHIDGLGEMLLQRWAGGAHDSPAPIYGPTGVEQVVNGFNQAYSQDFSYRVAHHGERVVPRSGAGGTARPFAVPREGEGRTVLDSDGLVVTAFVVDHAPVSPAVGYRFEYKGRSVLISGDTNKSANLQSFAQDTDLLVHEALAPQLVAVMTRAAKQAGARNIEKITVDIIDYHTSPVEVAEIARDAGIDHLLYYHIVPPLPLAPLRDIFLEGVEEIYDGPVTVGVDGTLISLPAGSDEIVADELL
jgi:ribonuclease Z